MKEYLPGTVIEVPFTQQNTARDILCNIFISGGLVLSQVSRMTGLEPHTVQNWVKRGFLTPPVKKQYTLDQFCRIATINMLKDTLNLDRICGLISYVNGKLDDDSDNLISDSELYFCYCNALAKHISAVAPSRQELQAAVDSALAGYTESIPGSRERICSVISIMLLAHSATLLTRQAESMISALQ